MTQTTLDLLPQGPAAMAQADPVSRVAFQIGWDHAQHALMPPPELLLAGSPVAQGWMAGRAVLGRRTLGAPRPVRLWLQLRTQAWRAGLGFDLAQVTPQTLAQLPADRCPVLRQPLGGAASTPLAAVVERLNPQAGYCAGNLVTMSLAAAQARCGLDLPALVRRARQAEICGQDVAGLPAAAWWRLAALGAMAQGPAALPFHFAARLPLAALPPQGVQVQHPAQALQAAVTQLFLRPGWAARARALAALLPAHSLRHDFHLFVGAMAPRVLEAGQDPATLRPALEDAWLNERVQRRWQHFLLALGEAACTHLLETAGAAGLLLAAEPAPTGPGRRSAQPGALPAVNPACPPAGQAPGPGPSACRTARGRLQSPAPAGRTPPRRTRPYAQPC